MDFHENLKTCRLTLMELHRYKTLCSLNIDSGKHGQLMKNVNPNDLLQMDLQGEFNNQIPHLPYKNLR
jgi:hypothetical protein